MSELIDISSFSNSLGTFQSDEYYNSYKDNVKLLRRKIVRDISNTKDKDRLNILYCILSMDDSSVDKYNNKLWMYNNGLFRTTGEVNLRNKSVEDEIYYKTEWPKKRIKGVKIWILFIAQFFFIPLGLYIGYTSGSGYPLIISIFLKFATLIYCLISCFLDSKRIIKDANEHNISCNDPIVKRANIDLGALFVSGTYNTYKLGKHCKESFSELTNPDKWSINV